MKKRLLFSVLLLSCFFLSFSQNPIGVNLAPFQDWSTEYVFKDAFKMCREWTQINLANGSTVGGLAIPLRPDGYPEAVPFNNGAANLGVRTFLFTNTARPAPEGEYWLIFDGTGSVRVRQSNGGTAQTFNSAGSHPFIKETDGHFMIDILQSVQTDPVRNIRFVMPGFLENHEAEPYHPDFLAFLENFECLRFMDWMRTNSSTIESWGQRTPAGYYSQTVPFAGNVPYRGVAYEHMVALCNHTGKDAWVNIPHMADDDYIQQFAVLLRDELDPSLKIYVEYSNELWNTAPAFQQATWVGNQGAAMGYPPPVQNQRRLFTAKRSADVFRIFENVFEDDSRIVKVLAAQAGDAGVAQTILNAFFNNVEGVNPDGQGVDALAIAPYFGNFVTTATDVEHVLAQARASFEDMSIPRINNHLTLLSSNGWDLPLLAYEGGQHLDGNSAAMDALFCEANRAPGMGGLYCDYFDFWYSQSGELFMHFSSTAACGSSGSWGLKEYTGQPDEDAPKFMALQDCVFPIGVDAAGEAVSGLFHVSPNPTSGLLKIENPAHVRFDRLEVFGMQGQIMLSMASANPTLDLSTLPSGLYFLILKNGNQVVWREKVRKE